NVSGEALGAIAHTWNIVGKKEYSFKCNPENGATVSSLAEIIVEIPEAKTAVLHNINNINLRSSDYFTMGAVAPKSAELLTEGYDHPAFKLVFDPAPTVETDYTLVFYYDAFYIDNAYGSVDATFKYTLDKDSGVEDVLTGKDNKFTVVSIDGKLLYKDASSEQIKALDKGIYIINGKKVVIK
ncbi:MAG: hypothetical protein K2O56_00865, partial [Muribaculaceae bacterium]|nr:hypothetical protein [Muribaculaceae bacterium]